MSDRAKIRERIESEEDMNARCCASLLAFIDALPPEAAEAPRHLRTAISNATRAFEADNLAGLMSVNEDIQQLVDAAVSFSRRALTGTEAALSDARNELATLRTRKDLLGPDLGALREAVAQAPAVFLDPQAQAVLVAARALVGDVPAKAPERAASDRTIFECRCCSATTWGKTDGSFDQPGRGRIDNIDGPNAICPECKATPAAIEAWRAEYPDARLAPERAAAEKKQAQAGDWYEGEEGEWCRTKPLNHAWVSSEYGWRVSIAPSAGRSTHEGPETGPLGQCLADLVLCAHGFLAWERIQWGADDGDGEPGDEAVALLLTPSTLPKVLAAVRAVGGSDV